MATEVFISETEHAMNGYDLVSQILDDPNGGVAGLIRLSEGQETEWLEFKAALYPTDGNFGPGEKEDDYRWHVAKAVIALANSVGGAVILGIDDNAQAIGLSASDPQNIIEQKGRETFNRDLVQGALIRTSWKTGREGTISLDSSSLHLLINIKNAEYQGHPVTVILVSPVPAEQFLVIKEEKPERYLTFIRDRGAVGRVRALQKFNEITDYKNNRDQTLKGQTYNNLWKRYSNDLMPNKQQINLIKLVGVSKQQRKFGEIISAWIKGNSLKPVIVLGEEGTGKTALINQVLSFQKPSPKIIKVSGGSYELDPDRFYIHVLAQLFSINSNYDGQVIERLSSFCDSNKLVSAKRLFKHLSQIDQSESLLNSPIAKIPKKKNQHDLYEDDSKPESSSLFFSRNELYSELWQVLNVFSAVENIKIVVWIEDAQRYEGVNPSGINFLMRVAANSKDNRVLLIVEFRAEHTRDINRIKEVYYSYCGNNNIETHDLKQEEIIELIATFIGKSNNEIPRSFSKHIYSNTGGNPKITLDFLKYLEETNVLKRDKDLDVETLLSPRIFQIKVPSELKTIYKNRIDHFELSKSHLEVLSIIACSPDYELPVEIIILILGNDCRDQIYSLIEIEILHENTYNGWKVRFSHLAARDACLEIMHDQDRVFLSSLKDKALNAFSDSLHRKEILPTLNVICRELCCIAGDGNNLAEKIVRSVYIARSEDIYKLEKWASVLSRVVVDQNYCVQFLQPYLNKIKIREMKKISPPVAQEYFEFSKKFFNISSSELKVKDIFRFLCLIIAECLANSATNDEKRICQIAESFSNFRRLIERQELDKKIIQQTLSSVARTFWRSFDRTSKKFTEIVKLYQQVRKTDLIYKVSDYASISSVAVARYICLEKLAKDGMLSYEEIQEDFSLARRVISSLLLENSSDEKFIEQKEKKELISFSELLIKTHIWQAADNQKSVENIKTIFDQIESICTEFQNTAFDDLEDLLVEAYVIYSRYIRRNDLIKSIEILLKCEQMVSSEWRIYLVSKRILMAYPESESFLDNDLNELQKLISNQVTLRKFNDEKFNIIIKAISILRPNNIDQTVTKLLLEWVDIFLEETDRLPRVVQYVEYLSSKYKINISQLFSLITNKQSWNGTDQIVISFFEKICKRNIEYQSREDDDLPIKELRARFDDAKKVYYDLDQDIREKISGIFIREMTDTVLKFPLIKEKEDINRLQNISNIIESTTIEKDIKNNISYWSIRWKLKTKAGNSQLALSECKSFMSDIYVDKEIKIFLLNHAAKLSTPYLFDFREFCEQINDQNISVTIKYLREWLEIDPESSECAAYLVGICEYCTREDQSWIIQKVLSVADHSEQIENFEDAQQIYEGLLFSCHRLKNRILEINVADKLDNILCKNIDITPRNRLRLTNNLLYVNMVANLERRADISFLIKKFERVVNIETDPDYYVLINYNFSILNFLAGNLEDGLIVMQKLLKNHIYRKEIRTKMGWLIVFIDKDTQNYVEIADLRINTAIKISGGIGYYKLGKNEVAKLWISAALENLQDQKLSFELVETLITAAEVVEINIPNYLLNVCRNKYFDLKERANNLSHFETYLVEKNALCPCSSGIRYKDCCRSLFI